MDELPPHNKYLRGEREGDKDRDRESETDRQRHKEREGENVCSTDHRSQTREGLHKPDTATGVLSTKSF